MLARVRYLIYKIKIWFSCFQQYFFHFQEARQALEKQKQLAKQNQEKENKEKLEALNKLKEARAAENEAKRLENERKLQEAEERRKIGKSIFCRIGGYRTPLLIRMPWDNFRLTMIIFSNFSFKITVCSDEKL